MIQINLLGEEQKKSKKQSTFKGFSPVSLDVPVWIIVVVAVVVIEIISLITATYFTSKRIDELEAKRKSLASLERQVKIYQRKIREVKRMIKTIKSLEKGRGNAYKILEEIADAFPYDTSGRFNKIYGGSLWLTSLSKRGNVITLSGKSFSAEAVAAYMINLGRLKNVSKVRFGGSGLRKISNSSRAEIYSFSIIITLKG
ncbi:PilN domain-containing protein [Hippea jasoniae]|uniref:PilN domain-containing protein n=1 Tax=Hippea jasoniae TaxID=944479 RepID=UPI00054E5909|nr:PilN domain-containing protein [Hippea jasoniae]